VEEKSRRNGKMDYKKYGPKGFAVIAIIISMPVRIRKASMKIDSKTKISFLVRDEGIGIPLESKKFFLHFFEKEV
jgi:hypothetical protein